MANNHIISFIQSLSVTETKIVDDYLQKSQPLISDEAKIVTKEYEFFKFIISNKSISISDEDIHNAFEIKDLSNLKINLYNKVLEAFTFDKYISNPLFNDNSKLIFKLKKKILVLRILLHNPNQNRSDAIEDLFNEIINDAKKNELFDVLIEALTAKKYFISIRLGLDEFNKIGKEIDFYDSTNKALYHATDCYYKLIMNSDFVKSLSKKELEKYLTTSIKQIKSDFNKTESQQINYYLHILQFAYFEHLQDFKKAIEVCNKLVGILKNNKIIYREERMGLAYINLSHYKTFLGNYKEAKSSVTAAQEYYPENSFNYLKSIEQEFYINFYCKEYDKALICVNKLLNHSLADTGEFRKSKFTYYEACILFATRKYKEALGLLNKSLEIEKDKARWNVALRILNIQIFIDLNKLNEASNSLESLRKYLERTSKSDEVKERDVLIVKLLREIEKEGFTLQKDNASTSKILKELSIKDKPTSWEHFSPELIPFHEWLGSKG